MPETEPIENIYIKAPSPIVANPTRTRGHGLRELFKRLRDRFDQELAKLNGLLPDVNSRVETLENHYKGVYASLTALQTAYPSAAEGDYANIDAGVGSALVRYVWDESDNAWMEAGGGGAVESVNGQTGVVVLTTEHVNDTADKRYVTDNLKDILQNTLGTNTGDQDISGIVLTAQTISTLQSQIAQIEANQDLIKINTQASSYSLAASDAGKLIRMNVPTSNTVTIPSHTSVPFPYAATVSEGATEIIVVSWGTGGTNLIPAAGVTLRSPGGKTRLLGQYSRVSLIKVGVDEWLLEGDLELNPALADPASNIFFANQNNLWSNPENWSYGRVPISSDRARIHANITLDITTTINELWIDSGYTLVCDTVDRTLTVNSDCKIDGVCNLASSATHALILKGANNTGSGTLVPGAKSRVYYAGTMPQAILPFTYYNLSTDFSVKTFINDTLILGKASIGNDINFSGKNVTINQAHFYLQKQIYDSATQANFTNVGTLTINGDFFFDIYNRNIVFTGNTINFRGGGSLMSRVNNFDLTGISNVVFSETQTISLHIGTIIGRYVFNNATIGAGKTLTYEVSGTGGIVVKGKLNGTDASSKFINKGSLYYEGADGNVDLMPTGIFDVSSFANKVYYSRAGSQNIKNVIYSSLIAKNSGTKTANGHLVTLADLNFDPLTTNYVTKLELGNYNLTVGGIFSTQAANTLMGVLSKSGAGTVIFSGAASIHHYGLEFTGNPNIEFRGGLYLNETNTVNFGTGQIKFAGNNQTVTSSNGSNHVFGNVIIDNIELIWNVTGSAPFTFTGIEGTTANSKFLNKSIVTYLGTIVPMNMGILDCGSFANTFIYGKTGNQTIKPNTYWHLTCSSTGIKSLIGDIVVLGNLNSTGGQTGNGIDFTNYNSIVHGTTGTGALYKSGSSGTAIFVGKVTVGVNSTWDFRGNGNVEFRGGWDTGNDDSYSFYTGTGIYRFTTNNQTIGRSYPSVYTSTWNCTVLIDGIELKLGRANQHVDITLRGSGCGIDGTNPNSALIQILSRVVQTTTIPPMNSVGTYQINHAEKINVSVGYHINTDYTIPLSAYPNFVLRGTGKASTSANLLIDGSLQLDGGWLELGSNDLQVNGITLVGGSKFYKSGPGNMVFAGLLNTGLNAQLQWTGNPTVELRSGLIVGANGYSNPTYNFGTGLFKFTTNNQLLQSFYLPGHEFNNPVSIQGITVTLSGYQGFNSDYGFVAGINGTDANSKLAIDANCSFHHKNAIIPMLMGIIEAKVNSYFYYDLNGSQSVKEGTYGNLTLGGTATPNNKTLQGNISVANTYSVTGNAVRVDNGFTFSNP